MAPPWMPELHRNCARCPSFYTAVSRNASNFFHGITDGSLFGHAAAVCQEGDTPSVLLVDVACFFSVLTCRSPSLLPGTW